MAVCREQWLLRQEQESIDAEGKTLRIGIIGTGNIGGMLAKAFAADGAHDVWVYNRSVGKARQLTADAANIHMVDTALYLVQRCEVIYFCTKFAEGQKLLVEYGPHMTRNQILVTTMSTMSLEDMEAHTNASVAKVIPSIVQSVRSGVLLVTYGPHMNAIQKETLHSIHCAISCPFEVSEEQIRVCSDLTSCGPAFLAFLLLEWAQAAACTGQLSHGESEHLLSETLIGVSNLLKSGMTLRDILQRVTVPGGVTEAGLASLRQDCSNVFPNLHQATFAHAHGKVMANFPIRS